MNAKVVVTRGKVVVFLIIAATLKHFAFL